MFWAHSDFGAKLVCATWEGEVISWTYAKTILQLFRDLDGSVVEREVRWNGHSCWLVHIISGDVKAWLSRWEGVREGGIVIFDYVQRPGFNCGWWVRTLRPKDTQYIFHLHISICYLPIHHAAPPMHLLVFLISPNLLSPFCHSRSAPRLTDTCPHRNLPHLPPSKRQKPAPECVGQTNVSQPY